MSRGWEKKNKNVQRARRLKYPVKYSKTATGSAKPRDVERKEMKDKIEKQRNRMPECQWGDYSKSSQES